MRIRVLKPLQLRKTLTTAVLLVAGAAAGCSGDVARFDDGFYTGAVPQGAVAQQTGPNGLDQTMTGSIAPAGGYGASAVSAAPTPQVQAGQLPPPPPPVYQSQPVTQSRTASQAAPSSVFPSSGPQPVQDTRPSPGTGAPPTSLQAQARQIATPGARPNSGAPVRVAAAANTAPVSVSRTTQNGVTTTTRSGGASTVTVSSGDTLSAIARRSGVSAEAIRQANGMSGDTVRLGQTLSIPTPTRAPTQVAANTASASKPYMKPAASTPPAQPATASVPAPSPARTERQVAAAEPQTTPKTGRPAATSQPAAPVKTAKVESGAALGDAASGGATAPNSTGISQFRWPVQGRVLARYGEKVGSRRNDGLNISVPRGTPVKAAENGVVIYAGDGLKEFGNTVLVKHDNGLVTVYGHADQLNVKRGDTVKRGQTIASSGMSGDTSVPQLHFEVRKNSAPIDPTKYLQ